MRRPLSSAGLAVTLVLGVGACRPGPQGDRADTGRLASGADSTARPGPGASAGDSLAGTRADSVVLRTDKQQYRSGEQIALTLENKGAKRYAFNPCTRSLEREEGGAWHAVPEPDRICTMEAWILEAHATRTGETELPSPLTPGRYRVVIRMTVDGSGTPAPAVLAVSDPIQVT